MNGIFPFKKNGIIFFFHAPEGFVIFRPNGSVKVGHKATFRCIQKIHFSQNEIDNLVAKSSESNISFHQIPRLIFN